MSSPDPGTLTALDWPVLLAALARHARTQRGAVATASAPLAGDRDHVLRRYAAVTELLAVEVEGERIPVGGVSDIAELLDRTARGEVLEGHELLEIGRTLESLERLVHHLVTRQEVCPTLAGLTEPIELDPSLTGLLVRSFDAQGELSESEYPELADLRRRIRGLHTGIRRTLDELVKGDALAEVLQDRFITQRQDRYVLPIRAQARRTGIGIVHDTSRSGDTVFIEPAQVVELNNDLAMADAELRRTVARILATLSRQVAAAAAPIEQALDAAVEIDLVCARAGLGEALRGRVPEVGTAGVIHLVAVRHPVLVLQGLDVIANDLHLGGERRGLVLSGPNTGGKTVALKCLGLAALLCRAGVPVPAAEGSRVDVFSPILADIGDAQAVEEGLSTFSGHVKALMGVLDRAGPGALVLLDELAVGTDPAQGAALAQAVLETLVDRGARVATTTHYGPLKILGEVDPRFASAAVQYAEGRPTFRVVTGTTGRSHAFSVAERLGLESALLERAREVMPDAERALAEALDALEEKRGHAREVELALDEERAALAAKERELTARERQISGRARALEEKQARKTLERLREAEGRVKGLIKALQRNPDLRSAGRVLEQVRQVQEEVAPRPEPPPKPTTPPPTTLSVGEEVTVSSLGGSRATVVSPPKGGKVEIQAGAVRTRVPLAAVRRAPSKGRKRGRRQTHNKRAREVRRERVGVRTDSNTLDLRGYRLEEAIEATDQFLDRLLLGGHDVGFLLHGHGTGVLKDGLRRWLPGCAAAGRWRPAENEQGGDAFTVVELGG